MKKFLIIGNMNAISCKEIFPLIKDNKIWYGTQYIKEFVSDSGEIKKFGNILWFTNLEHNKRPKPLELTQTYSPNKYPKYDNYDAINVDKVCDIPLDYNGIMGVPITFMDKYCPEQFEIIGNINDTDWCKNNGVGRIGEEIISRLRGQGNKSHVTANMHSIFFIKNEKVSLPFSRILIRFKK